MKDLNAVQLIGRLGQDPDVQYTDHGTARTTFSCTTRHSWTAAADQVLGPRLAVDGERLHRPL